MTHDNISGRDAGFRARQREAMGAFQRGASWYDAYWYPQHRPRLNAAVSPAHSWLSGIWHSWAPARPSEWMVERELVLR